MAPIKMAKFDDFSEMSAHKIYNKLDKSTELENWNSTRSLLLGLENKSLAQIKNIITFSSTRWSRSSLLWSRLIELEFTFNRFTGWMVLDGTLSITVIVIGNGIGDLSTKSAWSCLRFTWERINLFFLPGMMKEHCGLGSLALVGQSASEKKKQN